MIWIYASQQAENVNPRDSLAAPQKEAAIISSTEQALLWLRPTDVTMVTHALTGCRRHPDTRLSYNLCQQQQTHEIKIHYTSE